MLLFHRSVCVCRVVFQITKTSPRMWSLVANPRGVPDSNAGAAPCFSFGDVLLLITGPSSTHGFLPMLHCCSMILMSHFSHSKTMIHSWKEDATFAGTAKKATAWFFRYSLHIREAPTSMSPKPIPRPIAICKCQFAHKDATIRNDAKLFRVVVPSQVWSITVPGWQVHCLRWGTSRS